MLGRVDHRTCALCRGTGWWVAPDVRLVRDEVTKTWIQLQDLLLLKATQGVHVYILLYREVKTVLPDLRSQDVKVAFQRLHPNIRVIRHPNHVSFNPNESALYWSHHEKMVVVDQCIAIVGGMDLCPGRFDNASHVLHDSADDAVPKVDYYNPKAKKQLGKAYVALLALPSIAP